MWVSDMQRVWYSELNLVYWSDNEFQEDCIVNFKFIWSYKRTTLFQ